MHGDKPLHRAIEIGELRFERVELTAIVKLALERVADVMHAARGSMRDVERATARPAKRATCVSFARRHEIARPRAGVRERGELAFVKQIRRHARAAIAAVVLAARPRLTLRAAAARRDAAQLRCDRKLAREDGPCELALLGIDGARALRSQSRAQRDQLAGA